MATPLRSLVPAGIAVAGALLAAVLLRVPKAAAEIAPDSDRELIAA